MTVALEYFSLHTGVLVWYLCTSLCITKKLSLILFNQTEFIPIDRKKNKISFQDSLNIDHKMPIHCHFPPFYGMTTLSKVTFFGGLQTSQKRIQNLIQRAGEKSYTKGVKPLYRRNVYACFERLPKSIDLAQLGLKMTKKVRPPRKIDLKIFFDGYYHYKKVNLLHPFQDLFETLEKGF